MYDFKKCPFCRIKKKKDANKDERRCKLAR